MSQMVEEKEASWPSSVLLVACLALLLAGYATSLLRGSAPASEIRVQMTEPRQTAALR